MVIQNPGQVRTNLSKLVIQIGDVKDSNGAAEDSYKAAGTQCEEVAPEFVIIRGNNRSPLNHLAYDFPGVDHSLEAKRVDATLNLINGKMVESQKSFQTANGQADNGKATLQDLLKSANQLRPAFEANPTYLEIFDQALHQLGTASFCQNEATTGKNETAQFQGQYNKAYADIQDPLSKLKTDTGVIDNTAAGQATYSQAYQMDKRSNDYHYKLFTPAGALHREKPYLEKAQQLLGGLLGSI